MKFIVRYHFGPDFGVNRTLDAENKEEAMIDATNSKVVEFEEKGQLYRFNIEDVKYTTVRPPATLK